VVAEPSYAGRLLVAAPSLRDPNFVRTVVLLLHHSEEGAVGVVVNRPATTRVGDVLDAWEGLAAAPSFLFAGGPVAPTSVICLAGAEAGADVDGFVPLFGGLGSLDLSRTPDDVPGVRRVRMFVGHSGWAPGQLEGEIGVGAWFVLDAEADDAFSPDPDHLWNGVFGRQRGRLRLLATFPPDPRHN